MKFTIFVIYFIYLTFQISQCATKTNKKLVLDNIADIKDFKKLLRTKTNVLVCFFNSPKQAQNVIKVFRDVADNIKGEGTMALVDCSGDAKKMCKKLKIQNEPYVVKHYKDGDFNKDYDRKITVSSMTNFMRDPTGDLPWEEDTSATDVVHIPDANTLAKLLKKEARPILIMFYAPWCGFCKSLKPEYADAASELKDEAVLAAIDVNRPENTVVRSHYNITGFPTLLYFANGQMKYVYEGENKKNAIISFMHNPQAAPVKIKEPEWSDTDSEVVHLTLSSFDPVMKEESSVLVMFYAPWCGHCKKMKPEYESAAAQMKSEGIQGMLAAIDATKEQALASRYSVKGYPTVMYFSYGEQKFDVNFREALKIIEFMRDPKEPPPPPPPEKPWSDEESDVVHLTDENFKSFLKKKKHVLVIFYAPWCGHCKRAKPEFTEAAARFRDDPKVEFAAVDCTIHQTVCTANDVKGYPTLKYFSYYVKITKPYNGGRTADDFVQFMSNPELVSGPAPPPKETWTVDPSILHLNDDNFKQQVKKRKVVLVMFYAPWCGHCKKMKPDYMMAAKELHAAGFQHCMAMVDCTENPELAEEYQISGFPTIKLYINGKYVKDYTGSRTVQDLKNFVLPYVKGKDEL
ncbi:protein disulfide-isomerase A5 [Anoplophora glabripennis]|uniref:protein disulfide-isomerase A5 n=1 Tax=Anoplophora glabripennis TaxID=217634 RepID=UPI000874E7C5|nr:protein disulfide-isomerase A5 [Anoplophora glabripennis]